MQFRETQLDGGLLPYQTELLKQFNKRTTPRQNTLNLTKPELVACFRFETLKNEYKKRGVSGNDDFKQDFYSTATPGHTCKKAFDTAAIERFAIFAVKDILKNG